VRSPNIAELFSPQLNNFPNITDLDPCNSNSAFRLGSDDAVGGTGPAADGPDAAAVAALCGTQSSLADDVGFRQPFGQATAIVGGNPNLTPETADSWSAGFVFTPALNSDAISRMSMSVDYFVIELADVIDSVDALTIIQRCYNDENANPTLDPNNSWCQLFNREQSNGGIIDLELFQQNQAFRNVGGIDFTFDVGFAVGPGELGFNLVGTWLEKDEQQTSVADPLNDFKGSIGQTTGTATPEWKGTVTTSYGWQDLQVQLTTRYIDAMIHRNNVTGQAGTGTPETWYHDLSGNYNLTEKVTLRAGINNLTDQDPRLYTPFVQANTDPSTYDILGRRYFIGVNARF
jgi:outer membrane receptor protein involved in Fe transport